ncbi:AMP-binding protein [Streptosporangium sp. DT93]|uniref:AMP-binding protein n=1 Tax=Streptosporangium sp. DT93 TaxID=3393428 RepID=UPI003CF844E6
MENLHGFMLAAVETTPDKPATLELDADGRPVAVSYRELAGLAGGYTATLDSLGLDVGDRVVLEADTSAHAVAMLLACSALGLPFIPVSPQTPAGRLRTIIDAVEPALHVQPLAGRRDGIPGSVGTARFGEEGVLVERAPRARTRHRRHVCGTDAAYIIFTSGSTGRPKGVVMSHRAVIAFYRSLLASGFITADDRVASVSPLQFDLSLFDIGVALGGGATLVPVPRAQLNWPRRFVSHLRDTGVTQVDGVPSIWRPVLRHEPEALSGLADRLRGIMFAGEDFPLPELRRLQGLLPRTRIVNGFGATESMAASFTDVPNPLPEDQERLSIGFALPGSEMTLTDEAGLPIDRPGVAGEIYLRTPSLFTGYWADPEATRAVLVPDPLNPRSGQTVLRTGDLAYRGPGGELYFCGRADSQVQIRGHRVELGEVERTLLEFPGVGAAVALALPRPGGDPILGAFVVMDRDAPPLDRVKIRAACADTLPDYMIPEVTEVEELPYTVNGKVDRALLAARHSAN